MNNFLVLRFLSQDTSLDVQWAIVDMQGHIQQRGQNLLSSLRDVLPIDKKPSHCILLVPNEKVRITQVRIPSMNPAKIRQALPFAVEELIAEELETTHLAIGDVQRANNGLIDVAIVRHQLMIEWIDCCHQFDVIPNYIFPDGLCVPWHPNSWTFFLDGSRVLVRNEAHHAQAANLSLSGILLNEMILQSSAQPMIGTLPQINFYATEQDVAVYKSWRASISNDSGYIQRDNLYREDVFEVMAMQAVLHHGELLNLRQGGYKVPVDSRNQDKSWRQTSMVALAGFLLFAIICLGKGFWYKAQQSSIDTKTVALYKNIFPQATRIFNPRRQMEASLSAVNTSDDEFVATLVDVTKLLASRDASDINIQSLVYSSDKPDDLALTVLLDDDGVVADINQQLADTGLRLSVTKTTPLKQGVVVDLQFIRGQ